MKFYGASKKSSSPALWYSSQRAATVHLEAILEKFLIFLGILLIFVGAVWFLQGINILPGSFMTGQIQWAVYGALAAALGLGLIARARRE